tara:strand:+ start:1326 stop:1952 length:627 start_codon:yes stop_codon:yes gene_type:complete
MHKNIYDIKAAFYCSENLIKSFEEVKPFLGFSIKRIKSIESSINNGDFDILVVELDSKKNLLLDTIEIPKILIKKGKEKIKYQVDFIATLPVNLLEIKQTIIDLSQKFKFNKNSLIKIKGYILDKNQRVLKKNDKKIQITEKEVYFIETLFLSKKPLNKNFILENIWEYSKGTDTHTVETHIYRLRQKIKSNFEDNDFIKHTDKGYSI